MNDRELRLRACQTARTAWPLLTDERSRRAIEIAEQYAAGMASASELAEAKDKAWKACESLDGNAKQAAFAAWATTREQAWAADFSATREMSELDLTKA